MKESTKAKIRDYKNEFNKSTYKQYSFRLHKDKDKKMIEFLDSIEDKTNFIKELISEEMK